MPGILPPEAPAPAILPAEPPFDGELIPPDEAASIEAVRQAISRQVAAQAQADGMARRDAHAKAHATVQATFQVLDNLPDPLRAGVFAAARAYPAVIRFSNGSGNPQADWVPDGRGMAIKLLSVPGSASTTQDFVLIDHPVFFVRNAADYVAFSTVKPPGSFFVNLEHPRLHEAAIAAAIALQVPSNPLAVRYWSMTPYAFGAAACKFSARPAGAVPGTNDRSAHDFMRLNMVRSLAQADAAFDFMVQLRTDPSMPIEDPTIEWGEATAPFVAVARITIPRQNFDTPEQRAFGEALSFTPWHALAEHRPLGGINRVRRAVYETISSYRHQFNHAPRAEPVSLPVLAAPAPPGQETNMTSWFEREFLSSIGGVVQEAGWLTDGVNAYVINSVVATTRNRPHPWSTFGPDTTSPFIDYPTWDGLTDRGFLAMHLRPTAPPADLPPLLDVAQLFARPAGVQVLSKKSTCLFPAFAQYLTDGFIRTDPTDTRKTTSNHQIDLCPLYGRLRSQTAALRLNNNTQGRRGRLKCGFRPTAAGQDEEFPPALYDMNGKLTDPAFVALDTPLLGPGQALYTPAVPPPVPPDWVPPPSAEQLVSLFAVGGDRVNSTPFAAMINTLLLREHNRIAGMLDDTYRNWDDEHVFQVTRNVIIAMFIKIVVEEYINHITPIPFNLKADPSVAWAAKWNRPNWMTEEFSLLYRWHSLMPDSIDWSGTPIPLRAFTLDNRPLLRVGLDEAFSAASAQPTAALGAFNTETHLLLPIEMASIKQGRDNNLPPYSAYCAAFSHKVPSSFADISSNPAIQAILETLFGTPGRVEFYPGLFAEDRVQDSPLPGLLMTMVAVDAFSQALTNPLLSEHIWGDLTTPDRVGARDLAFSPEGFALIGQTSTLEDILRRQGRPAGAPKVTMTQPTWRYVDGW
jgi:prostaglandin-endoperoxide synthase 2